MMAFRSIGSMWTVALDIRKLFWGIPLLVGCGNVSEPSWLPCDAAEPPSYCAGSDAHLESRLTDLAACNGGGNAKAGALWGQGETPVTVGPMRGVTTTL